jgi:hypothetical protein
LNGDVNLLNMNIGTNVFTFQGFTLYGGFSAENNTNTLNVTDIVEVVGSSSKMGIYIKNHTGNVTLTDVDASDSTYGAVFTYVNGNVTVTTSGGTSGGTSTFNNNLRGLYVDHVSGSITINDVTVEGNTRGIQNNGFNSSAAILNCVTFSANGTDMTSAGSANNTNTQTSVGCGSGGTGGGSVYVPFPKAAVVPPVVVPVVGGGNSISGSGNENQPAIAPYIIIPQIQSQLPATLDNGNAFGSALKVELTGQTSVLSITLSFPIPDGKQDSKLTVKFWDGTKWVTISGGSVVNGKFVITVSNPGTYVLVVQ